ncbi:MAG: PilW family protein [Rudaea sp.]
MRRIARSLAIETRAVSRPRGFSLVELMIAMTLGLLLTSAILGMFSASGRVESTQSALSRLQENGRVAIGALTGDLQMTGRLPCGAQIRPQVFSNALPAHIEGSPSLAAAPADVAPGKPFLLDRGVFITGNACSASGCNPLPSAALGVPKAGHGVGDRVPATDILTLRYLQGSGWHSEVSGAHGVCKANESLSAIAPSGLPPSGFNPAHLALLASCTQAQIFAVDAALKPLVGAFGVPMCDGSSSQPLQLFDFDTQLQTSVYYLQLAQDAKTPARAIATLMRRSNGVVNEIVQGVERFDLRYSVHDADGNAHWLSADHVDRRASQSGSPLRCGAGATAHACGWSDVDAVDVDLLLNTIDDLPIGESAAIGQYRYLPDGEGMQMPGATMPMTGLAAGRMLRREFRTVVALRSLVP